MTTILTYTIAAFLLTLGSIRLLLPWLNRSAILDTPNERSNHAAPVPRGGGIAVIGIILFLWVILFNTQPEEGVLREMLPILLSILGLAIISWYDDVRRLPAIPRLLAQIIAVWVVGNILPHGMILDTIPTWAEQLILSLLWLWFINLYNFMDGIDGITGVETITISVGIAGAAYIIQDTGELITLILIVAGAAAGFLAQNWHPAKIFLGDVGSIPLGFILGALLWLMAAGGHWQAALIFPAYYLLDASVTLARRVLRGERIWIAHSEHYYQQAVRAGMRHDQAALRIAALNAALLLLGWISLASNSIAWASLIAAYVLTGGFLWYLKPKQAN